MNDLNRSRVLIAGGGVAALETLLALRELAGNDPAITLLSPAPDFVERPASVGEPFGLGPARRHPLWRIAREWQAELVTDALAEVDPGRHEARTRAGRTIAYDALVVAIGTRHAPAYEHALTFHPDDTSTFSALIEDVRTGLVRSLAFVAPASPGWVLPLYELAIMTARDAWAHAVEDLVLSLVSPERRPLEVFGAPGSSLVAQMLEQCAIQFVGERYAEVSPGRVVLVPGAGNLDVDRVVSLAVPIPQPIAGLPAADDGFLPTDEHGRVAGVIDVWAAGDATGFPLKQGGLAAQEADAVAESIAARCGLDIDPAPFRPVLRGMLLTGGDARWLRAPAGEVIGESRAALDPLWWPPGKVAGRFLAPYLHGSAPAPPGYRRLERVLRDRG